MKHFGDITKLSGYALPPVDVVTGGSPCQDLSVAGKREGLDGERSGLFFEQIRIIKELRDNDRLHGRTGQFIRPRFMVWENVCGAFSSNGGRDFQKVLTECVRIAEPCAPDVPPPPKGKWPRAGSLMGDGWSVAWRVLDAQYWGVPQRRKRIALVCDFGGQSAPEILFVGESCYGDSATGGTPVQRTARTLENGAYPAIAGNCKCMNPWDSQSERVYDESGVWHSLSANERAGMQRDAVLVAGFSYGQSEKARSIGYQAEISPTVRGGSGGNERACVYDARGNGDGQTVPTLTGDHADRVTDYTPILMNAVAVDFRSGTESDINGTLQAKSNGGYSVNYQNTVRQGAVVRRLTPLECERLQGFPDGWTDIGDWTDSEGRVRRTSDSARFRALGNSIALPPWKWVLKRIAAQYERDATLGSLFDGISGFPLIWEQINGHGSALWASEIEPFCVAVSKKHFGDSQTDQQGDLSEFLFRQISKQKSTRKINERLW